MTSRTTTEKGIAHCIRRLGECPDIDALRRVWGGFAFSYQREQAVIDAKDAMKEALANA